MNTLGILIIGLIFFGAAYRWYGGLLSRRFGIDPGRPTPAHRLGDGVDYVPSHPMVLLGHHFASISGAGPIVGPILGACFGWVPALAWILLGCVFIGAFHDFAAFFISVRHDGRSIGVVIERHLGFTGRQLFLLFCWTTLILVLAVFVLLVARTFTAQPAAATASLLLIAIAPLFGWLVYRRRVPLLAATLIFLPVMAVIVVAGRAWPCDLGSFSGWPAERVMQAWMGILFVYIAIASILPVWMLLQPRDYLNSFLLYALLLLGIAAIVAARPAVQMPAFTGFHVPNPEQPRQIWGLFPILFVVVACGAISGFHALVASGTSSKQVSSERHLLPIGYGAMLIEGVLALIALITVVMLPLDRYREILATRGAVAAFAGGLGDLAQAIGLPREGAITFVALVVSAFLLTTLDTATRLARFVWQELMQGIAPEKGSVAESRRRRLLANRYSATLISLAATAYLALSGQGMRLWPVFGASNQLLAGLTLLTVTVWLVRQQKPCWMAAGPMVFMLATCMTALADLFGRNLAEGNITLTVAIGLLMVPALVLVGKTVTALRSSRPAYPTAGS